MPAFFQRISDFGRHIILIMLGEHFRGDKNTAVSKLALGNDALPLFKQVRQYSRVFNIDDIRSIGHGKSHCEFLASLYTVIDDHTAEPENVIFRCLLLHDFSR